MVSAMFLEMLLQEEGFDVCSRVATGEEAIAAADRETPDLILMDVRLAGGMSGFEAAERIFQKRRVPIIFMTGYGEESVQERAMEFDPVGFLVKPLSVTDIKRIIAGRIPLTGTLR